MSRKFEPLIRETSGFGRALVRSLSVSMINQLIASGANFLFGLYLVRALTAFDFGVYGISLAGCLLLSGAGNALILTQMAVRYPEKEEHDRAAYAGRTLLALLVVLALFVSVTIVALSVLSLLMDSLDGAFSISCITITAAAGLLLKDFFVRHAYNRRHEVVAAKINLVFAVCILCLVAAQALSKSSLSAEIAMALFGASNCVAALFGYLNTGLPMSIRQLGQATSEIRSHLYASALSLLAHLVVTLRTQLHTIVVPMITGPAELAVVNAARILVSPTQFLMPALAQVFLPRLSAAHVHSEKGAGTDGLRYARIMFAVVAIYSIVAFIAYEPLKNLLIGGKYDNLLSFFFLWCAYSAVAAYRSGLEIYVIASRRFSQQLIYNIMGLIVGIAAIYYLASNLGAIGVVIALLVSECFVTLVMRLRLAYESALNSVRGRAH